MDFSNKDLKELIGSEFKEYEVRRENQVSSFFDKKKNFLNLIKSNDDIICAFNIDTKRFSGRVFSDDFETELAAIKDFHNRVLNMVAKKEAKQKKQAEMDKAANELGKAFQNYFKAMKASEER